MSLRPGSSIGPFKIQSLLGKGGMGEVFSALDTRLDRKVALKILPVEFATDTDRLRRFQSEAKVLASLNHPNILSIFEVGAENGHPFLVSELLEGRTLREELKSGALPLRKATDYALQIVNGLAAAHARGIIHRDLKPENIFITKDARLKILDFGLAKLNDVGRGSRRSESHLAGDVSGSAGASPHISAADTPTLLQATVPGLILGTPAYMSPEQVRGEPADHRSDVFAFGCVFYEMLSGRPPFQRETAVGTMNAILTEDPTLLTITEISPALQRIVNRCLEKEPSRRFQTADDLAFTVENTAGTSSIAPPSPKPRSRTTSAARLALPWTLAALALAAVLIVLVRKPSSGLRNPEVVKPLRKLELSLGTPGKTARATDVLYPSISPDGQKIVYANEDGLWLRWLNRFEAPLALAKGQSITAPFWSPASTDVAYYDGQKLMRVSITGSRPDVITTFSDKPRIDLVGGAWLLDDKILFTTGDPALSHVSARGGKVMTALSGDKGDRSFSRPTILPNKTGVLFHVVHSSPRSQTLDVWLPQSGRKEITKMEAMMFDRLAVSPAGQVIFDRWDASRGIWAFPMSLEKLQATGEPRRVSDVGYLPSVSNDGTLVCAMGARQDAAFLVRHFVWVDRSGAIGSRVGPSLPGLSGVRLSPDGRRALAMVGESVEGLDICLVDATTGQSDRITQNRVQDCLPIWWEAAHDVVFTQNSGTGALRVLRKVPQLLGEEQVLDADFGGWCWTGSPQTKTLLGEVRGRWGYTSLSAGTPTFLPLPEPLQNMAQPEFSPDGKQLAFCSAELGAGDVYVVDFPKFSELRQISRAGGFGPQWRPDGSELFYLSSDARSLMVAKQKPGGSEFLAPTKLFDLPISIAPGHPAWPGMYSASPDGQHFLMLENEDSLESAYKPNAMLIENWDNHSPP